MKSEIKKVYIDPPLPEIKLCQICKSRPVAGHVQGPGIYLERMCYRCYKSAGKQTVRAGGGWMTKAKGGR